MRTSASLDGVAAPSVSVGNISIHTDNRVFGAYEEAVEALGSNTFGSQRVSKHSCRETLAQFQAAVYPQGKYSCRTITQANADRTGSRLPF